MKEIGRSSLFSSPTSRILETASHAGYRVRSEGDRLIVDCSKSVGEWAQAAVQLVLGIPLIFIPVRMIVNAPPFEWRAGVIIFLFFLTLLMMLGLSKLVVGSEILFAPTREVFVLDKRMKLFSYRLTFFRKHKVPFSDISSFRLFRDDRTVQSLHQGRTFRRRSYCHTLQVERVDGHIQNVHDFKTRSFFIPISFEKETYNVRTVSKAIAKLLATESGKTYKWLGSNPVDQPPAN